MAIYHLEAKVVSRGVGRSACAAAAYMSCSAIYNNYDGMGKEAARARAATAEKAEGQRPRKIGSA